MSSINLSWPIFPFYTPWKHMKTFWFFCVFRGYKKGTLPRNGLIRVTSEYLLRRHLIVQRQHSKHQKNMWNLFRVNNKDTRMKSVRSFRCVFIANFEQIYYIFVVFLLFTLKKKIPTASKSVKFGIWQKCC